MKHALKVRRYLRYGDDFLIVARMRGELCAVRESVASFLKEQLRLALHHRNNIIVPSRHGAYFLGFEIFPNGKRLRRRTRLRVFERLHPTNIASYSGLIRKEGHKKRMREFQWQTLKAIASR